MNISQRLQQLFFPLCCAIFVVGMAISLILSASPKHTQGDFDIYYAASQHFLARAPIYTLHGGIEEFKYLPIFAMILAPLTFFGKSTAICIWGGINVLLFFFMFYFIFKLNQISFVRFRDLVLIVFLFGLVGRYVFANIKLGQANIVLSFLMVLVMYFEIKGRDFWAGFVLAFSLMIKFFPLLFLGYFILTRRFKIVAYVALMLTVFLLIPAAYTGMGLNLSYLHDWVVLLKSTPASIYYSAKNYSLLSFFSWYYIVQHEIYSIFDYRLITKALTPAVYQAWVLSCAAFSGIFFYDLLFVRNKDLSMKLLDYAGLFVCGLLFNPLAYLNALVLLTIPYFVILHHLFYTKLKRSHMVVIACLTLFSFILMIIDNKVFFSDAQAFHTFLECRPLMWTGILVFLSLWVIKFGRVLAHQSTQ